MSILRAEVGEIVRAEDISNQSIAARLQYGYAPFALFDTLVNVILRDIRYEDVDLSALSVDASYRDPREALNSSFLFSLVDNIDKITELNISKRLLPKKVKLDIKGYIDRFCNKHFKYRKMQLDCEYIIQAVSSELAIFAESNDIKILFDYEPTINLRAETKQKSSIISNEVTALKRIKDLFYYLFGAISVLVYNLECIAYKLRNKPIVNNITTDIDL